MLPVAHMHQKVTYIDYSQIFLVGGIINWVYILCFCLFLFNKDCFSAVLKVTVVIKNALLPFFDCLMTLPLLILPFKTVLH